MAHVFVTGGSGFLGRNLIEALVRRGDRVLALARSPEAAAKVAAQGATPVLGELHEPASYAPQLAGVAVAFHAAAKADDWGDPAEFHRANVLGTEGVIEAARLARIPTLVHVGTEAVLIGRGPLRNVDESRPLPAKPVGLYPRTKAEAEQRVRAANGAELRTVVVRPRFIWGRGDTTLMPKLALAVNEKKFAWIGGGRHLTSTCHVRNCVEALLVAAARGRGGEVYFATDGAPVEVRAFLTELLATQGVDAGEKSIPFPLAYAVATVGTCVVDLLGGKSPPPLTPTAALLIGQEVTVNDAKIRRELGYVGAVTREEGLAELRADVESR